MFNRRSILGIVKQIQETGRAQRNHGGLTKSFEAALTTHAGREHKGRAGTTKLEESPMEPDLGCPQWGIVQ